MPVMMRSGRQAGLSLSLILLKFIGRNKHSKKIYECQCECGKIKTICVAELNNGDTKSCGCLGAENRVKSITKHGLSRKGNSEYEIWKGMKARCYNKNHSKYADYGGRGIIVCERWKHSFNNFITDVGLRPSELHSIDRFPNTSGHYEPGNTRWATDEQQSRNKRNNRYYFFGTRKLVMEDWAKIFHVDQSTLWEHLKTKSIEEMLVFYYKKGKITNPEMAAEIETKLQTP